MVLFGGFVLKTFASKLIKFEVDVVFYVFKMFK